MTTARDWDSETAAMACGLGPLLIAKSSIRHGTKSFYHLGVRLEYTLHFKFYNLWL